ncbi:hypothetical protein GCM10023310_33490 [Paenibacillus vulneris]
MSIMGITATTLMDIIRIIFTTHIIIIMEWDTTAMAINSTLEGPPNFSSLDGPSRSLITFGQASA